MINAIEVFILPDGLITHDPAEAADEWSKAFYKAKDALSRIRNVPERLIQKKRVACLDEILMECDKALELGDKW